MPPTEIPLRTHRMKLPLGSLFWHEGGKPQGGTVVLLHGAWGDSTQWLPLIQHLAPSYHCLAPDLLGFGESSPARKTPYSVALQVDCLHSLLTALRISHCRLVAHSLGAWVAGQYALTYPDQVLSLAVMAPEGVTDRGLRGRWRRDRWLVAPWSPLPLVLPWLGNSSRVKALRDRRHRLRQSPAACQMLFQRRTAAIQGELLQQRLGQLSQPTLVVDSADDPLSQRLTQLWLGLLPAPQPCALPPADSPLGVAAAELAVALTQFFEAEPTLPSPPDLNPTPTQPRRPLRQLI